jgi:hypothetical protein
MNFCRTILAANARTVKHLLSVSALWAVLLLFGSALLSQAAIIQFTGGSTPNIIDILAGGASSTSDGVSLFQGTLYSTLTVSGASSGNGTYNALSLALFYTPDSLTVTGSIPLLNSNLAASSTLLTINFSAAGLTADTTSGNFVLNFPTDVTSIVVSPTLLSDLSLSAAALSLTALTENGVNSSFTFQGQSSFFQSNSSLSLAASTAAPEPSFRLIMIIGLGLMVFVARKGFSRAR